MKFSFQIEKTELGVVVKPLYSSDQEQLSKLKQNTNYVGSIKQDRNNKFTRKAFALVGLGYDNQEEYNNFEAYRYILTIEAGFYKEYNISMGKLQIADSWSEEETDQIKMEEIFNGILRVLVNKLESAPAIIKEQLEHYM